MHGWRGRIGLIVPSSNTTCEMEFHRMAPEGVSVHTARVFNPEVTKPEEKEEAMAEMSSQLVKAVREVASVKPGVILYACTTASFIKGPGYDRELGEKIRAEAGVPGYSTTTAVAEALKAFGLKKIILATPYAQTVGDLEVAFLEKEIPGLKIVAQKHLGYVPNLPKGRLAPESAFQTAKELDRAEADGIFISCTNWRTIEIIENLERDCGKPVVTSVQASFWMALKSLGVAGPKGYGSLFTK
jgi:maleate isomerase